MDNKTAEAADDVYGFLIMELSAFYFGSLRSERYVFKLMYDFYFRDIRWYFV